MKKTCKVKTDPRQLNLFGPDSYRCSSFQYDFPEPIWSLDKLGKLKEGDPSLGSYGPGHPWFYLLGGAPLKPDEIEPLDKAGLPITLKFSSDKKKYRFALEKAKRKEEQGLAESIISYEEILGEGEKTITLLDRSMGYGLESSIHLKHNHICYYKSVIIAIEQELRTLEMPND